MARTKKLEPEEAPEVEATAEPARPLPALATGDVILFGDGKKWTDIALIVGRNPVMVSRKKASDAPFVKACVKSKTAILRPLSSPPLNNLADGRLLNLCEGEWASTAELVIAAYIAIGAFSVGVSPRFKAPRSAESFAVGRALPFRPGFGFGPEVVLW